MIDPNEVEERAKGKKPIAGSKLLGGNELTNNWILLMRPVEDYLIKHRIHPNVLTITSLVVSGIAGVLYHFGLIFFAGLVLIAGSTFDMLDGRVARAQGISTKHGAFFDSCLDRVAEMFMLLGLLSYFSGSLFVYVIFLLLGSSMMVSYTRARAEGLGISCEVGIMQRTERIVFIGVASVFNLFTNLILSAAGVGISDVLLKLSILVVFVLSAWTVVQRMKKVLEDLKKQEDPPIH